MAVTTPIVSTPTAKMTTTSTLGLRHMVTPSGYGRQWRDSIHAGQRASASHPRHDTVLTCPGTSWSRCAASASSPPRAPCPASCASATGASRRSRPAPAQTVGDAVDVGRNWVVPGFIDTHVHGGGGAQLHTTDRAEIEAACRFHAAHGTTALLATTVPAPVAELSAVLAAIAAVAAGHTGGAEVLGAHLEGPFLNPRRPGALDPAHFRTPDRSLLSQLLTPHPGRWRWSPSLPNCKEHSS